MSRHCPICTQHPLRTTEVHGVQVDTCTNCKGHWLEHGELERLAPAWKADALWAALHDAPRRCPHFRHHVPSNRETCGLCGKAAARCPSCDEFLSQVKLTACAVDVCGRCHGLWLDAHELTLLRQAPRHTLRPLVGGAAVAAAVAATTLAATQVAPVRSRLHEAGMTAGEVTADIVTEVAVEGLGEVFVSGASTAVEVAMEGAAGVGTAVAEAMGAVLSAIAETLGNVLS